LAKWQSNINHHSKPHQELYLVLVILSKRVFGISALTQCRQGFKELLGSLTWEGHSNDTSFSVMGELAE
jgi:hypothetical protein